jgi:hypothetical protein
MVISSGRVGPRLPAQVNEHDEKARESWTLVLVATTARAGWWLGSGQAVRCLCSRRYHRAPGTRTPDPRRPRLGDERGDHHLPS